MSIDGLDVRRVDLLLRTPPEFEDWQQYMVRDDVWAAAGMRKNGGWLCVPCLQTRLGRPLTGDDLTGAPINDPAARGCFPDRGELARAR